MKLIIVLVSSLLSVSVWSATHLDTNVNLKVKNVTAEEFLKEVSKQTNVNFVVDGDVLFTHKISLEVKSVSLKKLMNSFAELENVNWENLENNSIKITAAK